MGTVVSRPEDAAGELARMRDERSRVACEPVMVSWNGAAAAVELRVPPGASGKAVRCRLQFEEGGEIEWDVSAKSRAGSGRADPKSGRTISIDLPRGLPLGAHVLLMDYATVSARCTVLSAPAKSFSRPRSKGRTLGVFTPLYSLRSQSDWGLGDLGSLRTLSAWASRVGCVEVGTLPLFACYLDKPFDPSPYAPVSRLFWNELFADIEASPEFAASAAARKLVGSMAGDLRALRRSTLVDYAAAYKVKRRVLDVLAKQALASPQRRAELDRFLKHQPDAAAYAAFRAHTERLGIAWRAWPGGASHRGLLSGERGSTPFNTHLYSQFLLHEQLEAASDYGRTAGLYLDLPVGVHADGFDVWKYRSSFFDGAAVGAPPDMMFRGGQNWGLPPTDPWKTRLDGHAYFRASLRAIMPRCTTLRIDHVMGLHRLFCIPNGYGGNGGFYVSQPAEELYAALCIESVRSGTEVVGENLGTVPPGVNTLMKKRGLQTMHVGQFGINPRKSPVCATPPAGALASLNTHDTPTFKAFWMGSDIAIRRKLGLLTAPEAKIETKARAAMRAAVAKDLRARKLLKAGKSDAGSVAVALNKLLAGSPASTVLVALDDLWGQKEPHNVPGTVNEMPNWRRKSLRTLEDFTSDPKVASLFGELVGLRKAGTKA